jgi:hypothetical protein
VQTRFLSGLSRKSYELVIVSISSIKSGVWGETASQYLLRVGNLLRHFTHLLAMPSLIDAHHIELILVSMGLKLVEL